MSETEIGTKFTEFTVFQSPPSHLVFLVTILAIHMPLPLLWGDGNIPPTPFCPPSPHTHPSQTSLSCPSKGTGGPTTGPAVPHSLAALGPTFPHSRELCSSDILEQLSSSASNAAVMVRERQRQREGGGEMRWALCVLACYQSPHSSHLESLYCTSGYFVYITSKLQHNVFYHPVLHLYHTACDPVSWEMLSCTIL